MMQLVVHLYPQRRTPKRKTELLDLGGGREGVAKLIYCYKVMGENGLSLASADFYRQKKRVLSHNIGYTK